MNLKNKKVKIKYEQIMTRKNDYSQKYINFLNKNKNTIFTAKIDKKHKNGKLLYTFAENDTWLFWEGDLEIAE